MNEFFFQFLQLKEEAIPFLLWYREKYGQEKLNWFQKALFEEQLGVYIKYLSEIYQTRFINTTPDDIMYMFKHKGLPF